jgi:hypothetical protein
MDSFWIALYIIVLQKKTAVQNLDDFAAVS